MSLMLIATDGTETGATAANKINAAISKVVANTIVIDNHTTHITDLQNKTTTSETDIYELNGRLTVVEPIVTTNTTNIVTINGTITALDTRVTTNTTNIVTINGTITALDTRTTTNATDIVTINDNITALDTRVTTNTTNIVTINDTITALDTRLSGVESLSYTGIVVKGATTQTVAIDTPTKVQWMQTVVFDGGKTAITSDLITQKFIFGENGIYKIQGTINIQAPTDDEIILELYVNGTPSTSKQYIVGKGITKPVTTSWFLTESFTTNDTISLFVTSSGTTVDVSYANLTIEKTAI